MLTLYSLVSSSALTRRLTHDENIECQSMLEQGQSEALKVWRPVWCQDLKQILLTLRRPTSIQHLLANLQAWLHKKAPMTRYVSIKSVSNLFAWRLRMHADVFCLFVETERI